MAEPGPVALVNYLHALAEVESTLDAQGYSDVSPWLICQREDTVPAIWHGQSPMPLYERVKQALYKHKPPLLVIDSLVEAIGSTGTDSDATAQAFMEAVKDLCAADPIQNWRGCGAVILAEGSSQAIDGSTRYISQTDALFAFTEDDTDASKRTFSALKTGSGGTWIANLDTWTRNGEDVGWAFGSWG